ncbi:MAG TPA: cryptochrome/photolyase family protein [Burkholderiaceae bacterium]|jgi:deoxyribodipyrimidine photolyase-related protein
MTTLRLILGDQLNPSHSWFARPRADVVYVMMEVRQETDYVLHHAQKILAIFAAMRHFAQELQRAGHRVHYLRIGAAENRLSIIGNLEQCIASFGATRFEYQEPDEWRLDAQLADYCKTLNIPSQMVASEHFFTARSDAADLFKTRKTWLMEHFYRHMRTTHKILLDEGKPVGGQWNFDHENRKAWPGLPAQPADWRTGHNHTDLWHEITEAGVKSFGNPKAEALPWPLGRDEARRHLDAFIAHALPHFGEFQDAMSEQAERLFHSLLSFALNTKMLAPQQVVARAEQAWREGKAPLAAVEGFIRQILGWREFVRGFYWAHMPDYVHANHFENTLPLPQWFWTGETKMRCVAKAIGNSLDNAHAHHIQRLMVIGNFSLLAGLAPEAVHRWYLGVYIDAFEWVELPNTLGMSQFADGGTLATKPYVSSAAYINRMSDSCKHCHYQKNERVGERACPFNALYWDFFDRHAAQLQGNQRLGLVYRQLKDMNAEAKQTLRERATTLRNEIETL